MTDLIKVYTQLWLFVSVTFVLYSIKKYLTSQSVPNSSIPPSTMHSLYKYLLDQMPKGLLSQAIPVNVFGQDLVHSSVFSIFFWDFSFHYSCPYFLLILIAGIAMFLRHFCIYLSMNLVRLYKGLLFPWKVCPSNWGEIQKACSICLQTKYCNLKHDKLYWMAWKVRVPATESLKFHLRQ